MVVVQVLNETYSEGLRQALSRPGSTVDDAAFISIDRLGADVRTRRATDYIVERLTFPTVRAAPNSLPSREDLSCRCCSDSLVVDSYSGHSLI